MGSSISFPASSSFRFAPFNKTKRVLEIGSSSYSSSSSSDDDDMAPRSKRIKHSQQLTRYDVFLSFRGDDTRNTFTSHLHRALKRSCFDIFHDIMLPRGEAISSQLKKAIEASRMSVIVFSSNYADSRWCLDELVNILDCRKYNQQIVLPIFLDVEPSDVRKQQGAYKKAFADHEANFDQERVKKWRRALRKAGELSGLCLQDDANGDEGKFIDLIVKQVGKLSNRPDLHVADHPVGIESRLPELISLLNLESDDVHIIAIWGVGGVGKTTIAKAAFNCIAPNFESLSFLADVKDIFGQSNGRVILQNQLISDLVQCHETRKIDNYHQGILKIRKMLNHQKILLVLDDVDNVEQLNILAIDREFFHPGSRIIVTTRNLSSVSSLNVGVYEPRMLDERESLELFSKHAFGEDHPKEGYKELSEEVVRQAAGLPLVLGIWGAHLRYFKSTKHWRSALKKLKQVPLADVQGKLKISYDSLDDMQKKLFLDIACFFIGVEKDFVIKVLEDEDSGCFPDFEIEILVSRCLVRIDARCNLWVHDIVRDMGREVVRQECVDVPGRRSRLWEHKDVLRVLRERSGTEAVESIILHLPESDEQNVHVETFQKLNRLRLIHLDNLQLYGSQSIYMHSFGKLKYLRWRGFPLRSLPNNLDIGNVVAIDLQYSKLEQMWEGIKILNNLRFLNVSHSSFLKSTPDFSGLKNLEEMLFNHCKNLQELHSSIECLHKLVFLDLRHCIGLKKVPLTSLFKLRSLKRLDLFGCSNIGYSDHINAMPAPLLESCITRLRLSRCNLLCVPSGIGSLMFLEDLDLSENEFSILPGSLGNLHRLEKLNLSHCSELRSIPDLPRNVSFIRASHSRSLMSLPSNMSKLKSLTEVWLDGCSKLGSEDSQCLVKFTGLSNLEYLNMDDCNVSVVPSEIGDLKSLTFLQLSGNTFCSLPASLKNLQELNVIYLNNCTGLKSLPLLPSNLGTIGAINCGSLDILRFTPTKRVDFSHCPESVGNAYANEFRRNILHLYQDRSCIQVIQACVSATKIPNWCSYQCMGHKSSFMPPLDVDRKVQGLIFCAILSRWEGDDPRRLKPKLRNETKGTNHDCGYWFIGAGRLHLFFYPLEDSELVIEKGNNMVVEFDLTSYDKSCEGVIECGLSLIYEGDEMDPESDYQQLVKYMPGLHEVTGSAGLDDDGLDDRRRQ